MTFGKLNYILIVAGFLIVVIGFVLMAGSGTTEEAFNPEIFSTLRIGVAPMVSLAGFIVIIAGILVKKKNTNTTEQ